MKFNEFLIRLKNRNCTKQDWLVLREKCSKCSIELSIWKDRGFNNHNAIYLLPTNNKVDKFNAEKIKKLGTQIALVK